MSRYSLPGHWPGLLVRGNIDIYARPIVWNKKRHGYSTVDSASWGVPRPEGKLPWDRIPARYTNVQVLVTQVIGNRIVEGRAAIDWALAHGRYLGIFDTIAHAKYYAVRLHQQQAALARKPPRRRR